MKYVVLTGLAEMPEHVQVFGPFDTYEAAFKWAGGFFSQECDFWIQTIVEKP